MNNDILNDTYAKICAEINKLNNVKLAMEAAGAGGTAAKASSGHKTPPGQRAPKGTLEQAILKALAGKGHLVNREIRAKIEATGYKFSLGPLHVGKTLTRMVAAKQVTLGHNGSRIEYTKA